jgi:hypothetical protein
VVTVLAEEDTHEAQQLPQNNNHEDDHEEENNEEEEEEVNKSEGEDDDDYTHLSDAEKDETFHNPYPYWQNEGFVELHQHHHSTRV